MAERAEHGTKVIANNKKARHDYHIEETYEAGLALILKQVTGTSVWSTVLAAGAVISIFSVTLVTLYGQTRILFAIDGACVLDNGEATLQLPRGRAAFLSADELDVFATGTAEVYGASSGIR